MLIELGAWLGFSAFLYHNLFHVNDRKKIDRTFENVRFGFKDQLPNFCYKHEKDDYTIYAYSLPFGLVENERLEYILEKTLNKPVHLESGHHLKIKVYKEEIKSKYIYKFIESRKWTLPIGYTLGNELAYHDFDKIPHMTVAGMTRQGKTVLLKLIMAHLIYNHPEDVKFYIIDLKGGLEFSRYSKLKQVKEVANNVDEAYQLLTEINKKINSDMQYFKSRGYTNVLETPIKKRTFIIVDEAAELTPSKHHDRETKNRLLYCQQVLSEVCRVAGALGYRNIFCTQYPTADTLPRQIKQNSDAKISFRLPTEIASRVAIDEQGAEDLTVPGRAIYRTHEKYEIQVPFITDKEIMEELGRFEQVDATREEKTTERGTDIVTFG